MYSFWQRLTLSDLALDGVINASYIHRWVGSLRAWRQQSWLMQWGDEIGAILTSFVFLLAPFEKSISSPCLICAITSSKVLVSTYYTPLILPLSPLECGGHLAE